MPDYDTRSYRIRDGKIVTSYGDEIPREPVRYTSRPPVRDCPECGHYGCDPRCPAWRDPEEDEQENGE